MSRPHDDMCVCRTCRCGLHNCPNFPGWPPVQVLKTPVPFGRPWKMDEVSTFTADFTTKPIYPPLPPRTPPRRWASDVETTHHDHFRKSIHPPPYPPIPFIHPKCGGYKDARSTYQASYKNPSPYPVSLKRSPARVKGGHICYL
ncbi:hypothetical protein KP509_14G034400 [Ceratopteris richardii]|uniref:Uncharacterized protein n=1 Tax=Ceratopteris richardii TaxID=49495 RepID=A0A8T2T9B4_CERRI|nr:hypothetical protein KP509_14G034400 [Ceratopteris richardii]